MENLSNVQVGINGAYRGLRGAYICLALMLVSSLRIYAALGIWFLLIWYFVGLHRMGKDVAGCRKAFILSMVNIVLTIISLIPFKLISVPASLVRCGIEFWAVYLVCTSMSEVTDRIGASEVRRKGVTAWHVNAVCWGVLVGVVVLDWILYLCRIDIWILVLLASVLFPLLAKIFYVLFLKACDQALNGGRKKQETD